MYEIISESETLVRSTDLCIERRGKRSLHFRLHEIVAPVVDEKYLAFPAPLSDVSEPKRQYVVRGNNEIDVVNRFIALTRNIKRLNSMFEDSKQDAGE